MAEAKSSGMFWPISLTVLAIGGVVALVKYGSSDDLEDIRHKDPARFRAIVQNAWNETPRSMRNADHIGGYFNVSTPTARQWLREAGVK